MKNCFALVAMMVSFSATLNSFGATCPQNVAPRAIWIYTTGLNIYPPPPQSTPYSLQELVNVSIATSVVTMPGASYGSTTANPDANPVSLSMIYNGVPQKEGALLYYASRLTCPTGYALDGRITQCVLTTPTDFCPIPEEDPGPPGKAGPDPSPKPPSCEGSDNDDSVSVGNPINSGNGNKYQIENDYLGTGELPLVIRRLYNSTEVSFATIGYKWRNYYDRVISVSNRPDAGSVMVTREDGKRKFFSLKNGSYVADRDPRASLSRLTDASGNFSGWQYSSGENDDIEIYQVDGKLISIKNRAGLSNTITYDGEGRLGKVTDFFGRALIFAYDATSRITSITDPALNVYQYSYSGLNLSGVVYPDNSTKQYFYGESSYTQSDLPYALTGIVDENGSRFASWSYDVQGRAISSEHANGVRKVSLIYNNDGSTRVVDPLQTSRVYNFFTPGGGFRVAGRSQPGGSGCGPSSTALTYDPNGNIATRTDFNGNFTSYSYDLTRNLETSRTEAYGTPQARTIATIWHPTYRLPVQLTEPGKVTSLSYDPSGNLLQKSINASGNIRTWSYTYNGNGSILTMDGPRTDVNDITSYTYYSNTDTDLGKRGNIASITNAAGYTTQITNYNAHGQPLVIVDPNGLVTMLSYDARQRLTSRNVGGEATAYTYDGVGQITNVTLPDSSYLNYTYDAAHRLTGISDNLGNKISYTLDAMGNRLKEDTLDPSNALAQTRSRVYDALNRLSRETGAQGQATNYAYDAQGNLTQVTDPLNHTTTNNYDALNRLVKVTDPNNGITQYGYNALDQLTQVTDPRVLMTQYTYDGLNNLNQTQSPDTGNTINTYDAAGNLLTQTDGKNQTTRYQYDALNRVTQITYADNSQIVYNYDQGTYGKGRLTQIVDATGTTQYQYDQKGRLTVETRTIGNQPYAIAYGYDSAGRLANMTYPSGRVVSYSRDSLGRISQINSLKDGVTQAIVTQVNYRPFGPASKVTFGNNQTYTRGFDQDGRIASYTLGTNPQAIGYDAASRIIFVSDALNPTNTANYSYDLLDRLTGFTKPNTNQSFYYDAVGNRTSQVIGSSVKSFTYSNTSNRLTQVSGTQTQNYVTDLNGSITNNGLNQFNYDARGRMIQANTAIGVVQYQINALGQRIQKIAPNETTVFHYDNGGKLIAETSSTAGSKEYVYLNDMPVGILK